MYGRLWASLLLVLGLFGVCLATHCDTTATACDTQALVLHYWAIKARNWWPLIVAAYGGLPLDWVQTADDWYKENTPFGQLPVLVIGGGETKTVIGQSLAVGRHLARLAKLEPEADLEKAVNDMLIQEMDDILGFLGKAHYAPVRKVAMDELFSNKVPRIMGQLERLMKGETFFPNNKITSGDLAVFSALDILHTLQEDFLDSTPKLKQFYQKLSQDPSISKITQDTTIESYYQRQ